jgi:hypothetical protein
LFSEKEHVLQWKRKPGKVEATYTYVEEGAAAAALMETLWHQSGGEHG